MKYARFEELVLVLGGAVILGSLAISYASGPPEFAEVVAQFLMFAVLFAAVRYGRRGGLVMAIAASAIYLIMRADLLSSSSMNASAFLIIVSRLVAFGLIGVAGGEICGRIRYGMARLEGASALDEWSRVYNQRWAHRTLDAARARFNRYGEPFSVVSITISPSVLMGMSPSRQRTLVRGIADHIRADVRIVDEVSRLDDGRFVVLLPHTAKDGGGVVSNRLARGTASVLGSRPDSISAQLMGVPEDRDAIDQLIDQIAPVLVDDQEASGEYSSAGVSTRNPAAESTSSAR